MTPALLEKCRDAFRSFWEYRRDNHSVVPRESIEEFHLQQMTVAYQQGRHSVYRELEHEKRKLLDGFAHPADCACYDLR